MGFAYFFALCFALSYGYITATNENARKFMLPFLDILQSVPILGFFPAAVLFFIGIFNGRLGVEIAAVFLIFTSMAWNMAFGVYESLTSIPKELVEASNSFGIRGWNRLESLILPACVPKLVYNSIISWSVGWFFLVASEIISAGSETYKLPGLGSFLIDSTYAGKTALMLVSLSTLVIIILLLELFIWKPMQSWANKYTYDYSGEKKPGEFIFNIKIIKNVLIAYTISMMSGWLPLFLPGGLGITDGTMALLFVYGGVPMEVAILATLLYRLASFWFNTILGGYYLSISLNSN
jgi:ABC-type anion transport system duplicated permease subunit